MSSEPPQGAAPFNDVVTVDLAAGEEAVIGYEPEDRRSRFVVPTVAASKRPDSDYKITLDGVTRFGTAAIPPTDIDDDADTFRPPREFSDRMEIVIGNLGSGSRTYHVQVVGWETRRRVDDSPGRGF